MNYKKYMEWQEAISAARTAAELEALSREIQERVPESDPDRRSLLNSTAQRAATLK